jgi:hypothetical protein
VDHAAQLELEREGVERGGRPAAAERQIDDLVEAFDRLGDKGRPFPHPGRAQHLCAPAHRRVGDEHAPALAGALRGVAGQPHRLGEVRAAGDVVGEQLVAPGERGGRGHKGRLSSGRARGWKADPAMRSSRGEHRAIIDRALWDRVRAILATKAPTRAGRTRCQTPALLRGLIFGPTGCAMTPTHTRHRGRLYRYYVSMDVIKQGPEACPVRRVPAGEIEAAVIDQVRALIRTPEIVVRTWRAAKAEDTAIRENDVLDALQRLDPVWEGLFPAEQARILQLLVERVDVSLDGIDIRLRTDGLTSLVADLRGRDLERIAAA